MVSSGKATLAELNSVYSWGDLQNLVEIIQVDAHNARVMARLEEERRRADGDR